MVDHLWEPLRFFEGEWTGNGRGEPGISVVNRSYHFVLGDRYLQVESKSIWKPTDQYPEGEVHTEMGMFSFDKTRKLFVFRVFHVEGFVNQFRQELEGIEGYDLRFVSEQIENIAPGWRVRENYRILGRDEFQETFELAAPDKDFELYTKNKLKRTR